ncbi:MAG TPA: ring-opening amidohydrolase [Bradyrhizobium sp.]|uniref:cyanuric acid amidohydrolase n=1 Tax=Bradyrhizobium sp. TaxID=376 RepID=UPI002D7F07EF|nr:ring-opening amidohydrolase [Bradyrhizobium sp.]HET7886531.1 ring-opening amidohydrolase [Bradyrhizobium sp.]
MSSSSVDVIRIPTSGPGDTSGLIRLIEAGKIDPNSILAILGKTEGNGGVNDFTREYSTVALTGALAPHLGISVEEVEHRIAFVMSGGTEGVLSPHITVFTRTPLSAAQAKPGQGKRLGIGIAHTREFHPEELGRQPQIAETAAAVRRAMREADITEVADVHFVQVKCPLLTSERVDAAEARGASTATKSSYASMGYSRGASALGVALALGELESEPREEDVLRRWDLFSSVASSSAGIELMHNVVVVMGNSASSSSELVIGHAVMKDAIDAAAIRAALASVGLRADGTADAAIGERVVNIFAKAEAAPDGFVRGLRHTMLNDTDISSTRHARAAVGGLVSGLAGTTAVYVSGGAEHQGPAGGGPIAVIARA